MLLAYAANALSQHCILALTWWAGDYRRDSLTIASLLLRFY